MANPSTAGAWARIRVQLIRYRHLLVKRWWVPLLTVSLGLVAAAWLLMQQKPVYVSNARLMVSGQIRIDGTVSMYTDELVNFFGTQLELMQSPMVSERAHENVKGRFPNLKRDSVSLAVGQVPKASIFSLRATGQAAEYTQRYLDAVMAEYILTKKEKRQEKGESASSNITSSLVKLEGEMKLQEDEMHAFQEKTNIGFLHEEGNSAAAYLSVLNRQLAEQKTEFDLLALLDLDQNAERQNVTTPPGEKGTGKLDALPSFSGPLADYQHARQQLQQLTAERETLLQTLKPQHPTIAALNEQIAKGEALLATYRQQSIDSIKSRRESIHLQIENLQTKIKEWEAKALVLASKIADHDKIKSRADRTKAMYEKMQTSRTGLDVTKTMTDDTVSVLEPATVASAIRPGLARLLLMGAGIGLILGLGILFILDKFDDRISSFYEFRERFPETLLGQVPREKYSGDAMALLSADDDRHALLESFRTLRSSIIFLPIEGARPKTLLVTSATPSEGKTTIASNLAITLAFSGAKVLLVDADLRLGRLHKSFGISADVGFSDVMRQQLNWREAIVSTSTPNLSILPRGKTLSHPAEHFLGKVTDQFLREVYAEYDYVVFDSPPVMAADDVLSLAPKIDCSIFVVRFSTSSARRSRTALDLLTQRQANVLGVVCNDVKLSETEYGYGSYYQYSGYHYREREAAEAATSSKPRG